MTSIDNIRILLSTSILLAWPLSPMALLGQAPNGREAADDAICVFGRVTSTLLMIDGDSAYVDPQSVASHGDEIFLAGVANHLWTGAEPRSGELFGVLVGPGGAARAVPPPLAAPVGGRLVARAANGGWRAVYAEVAPEDRMDPFAEPIGLWTGVWNGRWTDVRPLTLPPGFSLDQLDPLDAALLPQESSTWLAMRAAPREHLVVIRVDSAGGESGSGSPSPGTIWVTHRRGPAAAFLVYIASPPPGLDIHLIEARVDPGGPEPRTLHTWRGHVYVAGLQAVDLGPGTAVLVREREPMLYLAGATGPALPVKLPIPDGTDAFLAVVPDGPLVVVTQERRLEGGEADLRVVQVTADGALRTLHVVPSPFSALQAVIPDRQGSGLTLIGTVIPPLPSPVFATSVAELPVDCSRGGG